MKRLLIAAVALLVVIVGVGLLKNATHYDGGVVDKDGTTTVAFTVHTKGYGHDQDYAAAVLWQTCIGSIHHWNHMTPPARQADRSYVASVRPFFEQETLRRLKGCLTDATIDHLHADVARISNEPADSAG